MEISLEFLLCPPHGNTGFVSPTYRNIHFIYEEIMPQLYIWFSVIETGIMGFSIFLMGISFLLNVNLDSLMTNYIYIELENGIV